ncbi:glycosyltransferase family 92 protein [Rhizobium sp. BR 362]|uniref:glycosyltransferase family 92 protein n=1 Tax=Rhizobium sp. BR 362 TaxID=3040670 RepID=UPI002F4110BE
MDTQRLSADGIHRRRRISPAEKSTTIEEALAATGDFPNVSLPWHMFGTSGHKTKPEGPVLLNYTKRGAEPLSPKEHSTNFKCIVDPCEVVEVSIHQFKTREFGDLTVNDAGHRFTRKGRKSPAFYSNQFLQLNHYYSKSEEEMRTKMQRSSNFAASHDKLEEKMRTTIANIEANVVEDYAMSEFVTRHRIDLTTSSNTSERVLVTSE